MILGVGVDIVECRRFESWLEKPDLLERYFSAGELALAQSRRPERAAEALASRFAAREALGKALGTGLQGLILKEVPLGKNEKGQPRFEPSERMRSYLEERGVTKIHLSLSHEKEAAVAVVCLEGEEK